MPKSANKATITAGKAREAFAGIIKYHEAKVVRGRKIRLSKGTIVLSNASDIRSMNHYMNNRANVGS